MKRTLIVAALLLVAGALPALSGARFVAAPADAWGLLDYYTYYDLVNLDPDAVKADLVDGVITLALPQGTFDVVAQPAPWDTTLESARLEPDGSFTVDPATYARAFYQGAVGGHPGSRATIGVTGSGVGMVLSMQEQTILLEPVQHVRRDAPRDLVVVATASDVRYPVNWDAHLTPPLPTAVSLDPVQPVADGVAAAGVWPDRAMTLWADKEMTQSSSGWSDRVWYAFNTMKSNYNSDVGFTFTAVNNKIYYCTTDACQQSFGMTSTEAGTLLREWPNKVKAYATVSTYEIAHLFTGKTVTNNGGVPLGAAWQPGRYGYTKAPGQIDYNMLLTHAHETGHSLNGDHGQWSGSSPGRATTEDHNHPTTTNHCHLGLLGFCFDNHPHTVNDYYTHYDLMWPNIVGNDGHNEQFVKFHSANKQWVKDCDQTGFTGGTKDPASWSGFGWYCLH